MGVSINGGVQTGWCRENPSVKGWWLGVALFQETTTTNFYPHQTSKKKKKTPRLWWDPFQWAARSADPRRSPAAKRTFDETTGVTNGEIHSIFLVKWGQIPLLKDES